MEEYGFREVEDPKNPFALMVQGEGLVTSVSTESRAGTAEIDIAPTDGEVEVIMQIGPVYRGSAVRDAITFLTYGDFTNQMEWASVGQALNERAGALIFDDLERSELAGKTISFAGAFSFYQDDTLDDETPVVMPVLLDVQQE
jgi:predicted lipoprotein